MKYTLTNEDYSKWGHNLLVFLIPLGTFYVASVVALISQQGHVVTFQDFIPSNSTISASVLYVGNALLDLFRKWRSTN